MSHYYPVDNVVLPSVTTILSDVLPESPAIAAWRRNLRKQGVDPAAMLRRSQIVGTITHYRCLNPLGITPLPLPFSEIDEITEDMLDDVNIAQAMWVNDALPRIDIGFPRLREQTIANPREKYAGQFDLYCPAARYDPDTEECLPERAQTLIDLKTSKAVYETHLLQIGGYTAALRENGMRVDQAIVVALHPNVKNNPHLQPDIHYVVGEELEEYVRKFIEYAREFHRKHEGEVFEANS